MNRTQARQRRLSLGPIAALGLKLREQCQRAGIVRFQPKQTVQRAFSVLRLVLGYQ